MKRVSYYIFKEELEDLKRDFHNVELQTFEELEFDILTEIISRLSNILRRKTLEFRIKKAQVEKQYEIFNSYFGKRRKRKIQ